MLLQNGVVIGADGFGFAKTHEGHWYKIPQPAPVVIEDDVEVQANSCIDRASVGETRIRRGVKVDNLVQVGQRDRRRVEDALLLCLAGRTFAGLRGNWQARGFQTRQAGGGGTLQGWGLMPVACCPSAAWVTTFPLERRISGEPQPITQIMAEVFCAAVEAAGDGTGVADQEVIQRAQAAVVVISRTRVYTPPIPPAPRVS